MKKSKIVIIGAGFAGVYTARHLRSFLSTLIDVELINVNNYFVFQPLLPEVASGTLSAQDAVVPLRAIAKGVSIRQAEVVSIDKENKLVKLLQGSRRTIIDLPYDQLVLTSGVEANCSFIQGMDAHAMTIKNLADAYQIRNHIIQCLEWADVTISPETKKKLLTFVVAGGGFSGVETMGEIVEMLHRSLRFYPNIDKSELRPIIVQRDSVLLPELHEKLGRYTEKKFAKRGIRVVLNQGVSRVTANEVTLENGETLPCASVISSIGNRPSSFIESIGLPLERNRIQVAPDLRVKDSADIWALGDIALIPLNDEATQFAPPTAQFAVQEAKLCAANIMVVIKGEAIKSATTKNAAIKDQPTKKFAYTPRGSLASLGSYSGVGELFGLRVSGILGWAIWRGFYIMRIPGIATKIRITLNWIYDYFLPRSIVHLEQKHQDSVRELHYAAGDIVFHKGQILDALYIVKSGRCVMKGRDGFSHEFGSGDHFGERLIEKNHPLTGEFIALEDSVVIKFDREPFSDFRHSMPVLDEYFNNIEPTKYTPEMRD